ncbi:MAG: hypothetical protein J6U14_03155 [Bacteroidaceae bacterium]|nr:hypothetical protein [Bacteroidaceae bacterium]
MELLIHQKIDDIMNLFNLTTPSTRNVHESERLANHYCVDGRRGEAKKIALPRELVIWE